MTICIYKNLILIQNFGKSFFRVVLFVWSESGEIFAKYDKIGF